IRPPQLSSNGNKGTRVQGHFSQAAPYCRKKGLEALIYVLPPSVQIPLLSDISAPDRNLFAVIYRGTWLSIAPLPYWVRADRQIFYDSSSKICVISLSTSRSFSTGACRSVSSCASSPRSASNLGDWEWGAAFGGWTGSGAGCADSAAAFNWPARLRLAVSAC